MPQGQLNLAIPQLDEKVRVSDQRKLNAYAHACGCFEGSVFALTALAIAIAFSVFRLHQGAGSELIMIWLACLPLIIVCAFVGKMTGKFVARLRFRRTCAQLIRSLRPEASLP